MNRSTELHVVYDETSDDPQQESMKIKHCLYCMFSRARLAARNTVCVAGSAALHWLMLALPSIPKERYFQPNDIDIFIFGRDGRTKNRYVAAVDDMVDTLVSNGYELMSRVQRKNLYILPNIPVYITDIHVAYMNATLSFVQCPVDRTAQDVIDRFDINVVKVIYDIATWTLTVNRDVQRSIELGQATVRDFIWEETAPSYRELYTFTSTLHRMEKFTRRGFHFIRTPTLQCNTHDVMAETMENYLLEGDLLVEKTLTRVIDFMEQVIPQSDLKSGTIGLFGELPLMEVLCLSKPTLNQRIPGPWEVKFANICVCGDYARSTSLFHRKVRLILSQISLSKYEIENEWETDKFVASLPMLRRIAYVEVKGIDTIFRFICCTGIDTCEQVAEASMIGIERVWYNFNNNAYHLNPGVKEQLESGIVKVNDIILESTAPTRYEIKEIVSLLQGTRHFHSRGFLFENFPKIVQS